MEKPLHTSIFRPSALLQAYLNESTTAGRIIEASCLKFMDILLYLMQEQFIVIILIILIR